MEDAHKAVVMGCSAGGLAALRTVLSGLSARFPLPVIVVCHSGSDDIAMLCDLLATTSVLPVSEACERESARPGHVHLAPTGYHLMVEAEGRFALSVDERIAFARPAIDALFESAVSAYRGKVIGVVMTGANSDGAAGLKAIRMHGGVGIVQDPATAYASAMPQAALDLAGADRCVPLEAIAPTINRLCRT